ncbi:adenosylcobinamide-GDP ribazoletransferase [Halegenticoccus tardaugens]|uniref:adenosylcobinamide-GDP ribazoletransferase n=1 Tax=Halegenticoccus tardaugens TaxID=2071624 RepID=UPI001E4C5164|nr:adenosylcobinamide-GDP ribazoletransferase [Halegenticoccus tardaugens]
MALNLLPALRGAVAFLTRLPVGGDERAWEAFRRTPAAFPLAGYLVGAIVALPLVLPVPPTAAAALYLATIYLVTGVAHADGLADLGDAAAVHGDAARRRAVLKDSATGVGGALALGLALVALGLGALGLAGPGGVVAFRLAVAAEVGTKAGMALLVCLGDAAHEGLGSKLVDEVSPASLPPVALAALPAALLPPSGSRVALVAALLAGPVVALLVGRWAKNHLGGISGDALGAANELGRVAAVHAGVIAWTAF